MLTRIEIDGFKTFEGFGLDLGPMQVILGPNASGKSNLFDAIRLLSNLAGSDLRSSVRDLRGEPVELFSIQADGSRSTRMTFAVELLLAPEVRDPWGFIKIIQSWSTLAKCPTRPDN
jgi:AAA15 family ATPase/GTPase